MVKIVHFISSAVYKIIKYVLPQPVHAWIVYSDSARKACCLLVLYNIPTNLLAMFYLIFFIVFRKHCLRSVFLPKLTGRKLISFIV